jgi:hypothetical protein
MKVLGTILAMSLVCSAALPDAIKPVPMSPATMEELAQMPDVAGHHSAMREHTQRTTPFIAARYAPAVIGEATPPAPPPKATVGFRTLARPNIYPADAAGAVSARFVVGATNDAITVYDRAGTQLSSISFGKFWTDPSIPFGQVGDPQIVYDAARDRWILTACYTDSNFRNGRLLIAISEGGDPTGAWKRYSLAVDTNGMHGIERSRIAQSADAILVTTEEWVGDYHSGIDVFTIAKSYASSPTVELLHLSGEGVAPIQTNDASHKAATVDPGGIGGGVPAVAVSDILPVGLRNGKVYYSTTTYSHGFSPLNLGPQLGTSALMDCGDTMIQNGVLRNGVLWLVQTVLRTPTRSAVLVWKISGDTAKTYLIEDGEFAYAFPSIAVNRFGGALIAYSAYNGAIYPSIGYNYIDPAGNMSASAILKNGDTWYAINLWGDYTTTLVDPVDDTSFWTLQIYPVQPNSWATWWSYIPVTGISRNRATRH